MEEKRINFNENELQGRKNPRSLSTKYDDLTWGNFFLFFLTYLLLIVVISFFVSLVFVVIDSLAGTGLNEGLMQIQYASLLELGAFLITILIFRSIRDFLKDQFDFTVLKKWSTYLYLLGAYVLVYAAQILFIDVLEWEQAGSQIDLFGLNAIDLNVLNILLLIFAFVVIAPITEEILFRGVLFGFLNRKIGVAFSILINLFLFGLLHPGHHFSTAIMALAFILLYVRTKSLITPILFHMIWNAMATYTLLSQVILG